MTRISINNYIFNRDQNSPESNSIQFLSRYEPLDKRELIKYLYNGTSYVCMYVTENWARAMYKDYERGCNRAGKLCELSGSLINTHDEYGERY